MSSTIRFHKKSRTGCRTCKTRRVKCDETFPACLRCSKMGQVCGGYGIWGGGGANVDATKPSHLTQDAVIKTTTVLHSGPTSNPGISLSSDEQYYLDWFINGTVKTPPRVFNSSIWEPAILKATAQEPMILHALLALSAVHQRHALDPVNRNREGLPPDAVERFVLKHYGRAIRGLKNHLGGYDRIPQSKWFAAATMSALLVVLSLMRGRFDEAMMHTENGALMIKHFNLDPESLRSSPPAAKRLFLLQGQRNVFLQQQQASKLHSPEKPMSAVATCNLRFGSPAEAKHHLLEYIESVAILAQQERSMPRSATAAIATHHQVCLYVVACMDSWLLACNATMEEQRSSLTMSDLAAYDALREHCKVAREIAEKCIIFK